ncbi:cellulose biosynthesis protein BcsO [Pantoea allii]|uniref:cellulose biosynthesis protein BcsO n=1 Tax=Pantoea allii TaxID=574096 RepID=UPI0024B7EE5C|nr:cellulose biosynthesis protein BcsO [Pantoea allii]MDJ0038183.1 cellulose biosynthesis protein BcsO [Pantoea allii]
MKNYDDLQRFKEKTKTLDIAFQDMSGQSQEAADKSKWSLIRQLACEETQMPFSGGQRIDLPQPQPIQGDEFSTTAVAALSPNVTKPAAASSSSIMSSLNGNEPHVEVVVPVSTSSTSSLFPAPAAQSVSAEGQKTAEASPVQENAIPTPPVTAQPNRDAPAETDNGRFSGLFRARNSGSENLPKETLLKPLLEKIALCR